MLEALLPIAGDVAGKALGGGSTRQSVAQSTNVSLSISPVIANQIGDGGLSAQPSAWASGTAPSYATAQGNDGQSDPFGYLPSNSFGYRQPAATYGDPTLVRPASGAAAPMEGDGMIWLLLLAGGAALLFMKG